MLLLLHGAAGVALAQTPGRVRTGPPIDSVRVTFGPPEKTIRVEGYVLDNVSRRPVPKVSVLRNASSLKWARTDASGHFVLYIPAWSYKAGQLLTVQTLYYEGTAAIPADTGQSVELLLKRNALRFKPHRCQQPADSARISPYAMGPILGLPGSQFAFLIRGTASRKPRQLQTVTLNTGPNGFAREVFRLHVYSTDNQYKASPGADLLEGNIILYPEAGTFSYDVSSYNIVVPASGFYLALEYLGYSSRVGMNPIPNHTVTGQVLRSPCAWTDTRTWSRLKGQDWHRATATENCWPFCENALSVEVEPAPAKR